MKKKEIIPNTIYCTTDFETLSKVVEKADEANNSDLLKSEFVRRLANFIINGSGIVLVSFDEKKELNGCVVLSRHLDKKGEYIWIDFRWNDPHNIELFNKFYNEVIGTCKVRGVKRIQGRSDRGFRVVKEYYGAYEIGKIFEVNVEKALMKNENKK